MYLYKYLFKGPDHAYFQIQNGSEQRINEIDDYIWGRYICATEAAWQIFAFDITTKQPSVTCLPIHLPGQNISQYSRTNTSTVSTASLLIRYFHRPNDDIFRNLSYIDYFNNYVLYEYDASDPSIRPDDFLENPIEGAPRKKVRCRQRG
jgi:hypothetical protein